MKCRILLFGYLLAFYLVYTKSFIFIYALSVVLTIVVTILLYIDLLGQGLSKIPQVNTINRCQKILLILIEADVLFIIYHLIGASSLLDRPLLLPICILLLLLQLLVRNVRKKRNYTRK